LTGNHILLNFAETPIKLLHPITFAPYEYLGVEWRFQAVKCLYSVEDIDWIELHDYIATAPTAQAAKTRGREFKIARTLWDGASFAYMLEAHIAKFFQNRNAERALVAIEEDMIVEHRPDPIWGDNMDGTGKNLCGKSLVLVRDMLRSYRGTPT
jgi:ribA/ribD-fused uncharacterized protein